MYLIYSEWCAILLFIVIAVILSCLVFGLSYAFIARSPDLEKSSAYECGFNPFEDFIHNFNNSRQQKQRGPDKKIKVQITPIESYFGINKPI